MIGLFSKQLVLHALLLIGLCNLSAQAAVLEIFSDQKPGEGGGEPQVLGADWMEFGNNTEADAGEEIPGQTKNSKEDPFHFLFKSYSNLLDDQPVEKILDGARDAYAARDFERALGLIEQVLKLDPDHTALLTLRAAVLMDLGRLEEAMTTAKAATDKEPENLIPKMITASCLTKVGSYEEAKVIYQEVLSKRPLDVPTHQALAAIAFRQKDIPTGIKHYTIITEQVPNDLFTRYKLGVAYRESGELQNALQTFQSIVEQEPTFASAFNELGIVLLASKEKGKALEAFATALKLNPKLHTAYANIAAMLAGDGQKTKAIGYWLRALDVQLTDGQVWNNLLRALDTPPEGGNPLTPEGTNVIAQAIAEAPIKAANGYYRKAVSCFNERQVERANHHFVQALLLDMNNPDHFNGYGAALASLGHDQIAKPFFQAALHIYPEHAAARQNLNAVEERLNSKVSTALRTRLTELERFPKDAQKQFDAATHVANDLGVKQALPYFMRAAELDEKNITFQIGLSMALSQLGQWQASVDTFMNVYRSKPGDPDYQYRLAWLLLQKDVQKEEEAKIALRLIRKALNQSPEKVTYLKTLVDAYIANKQTDRAMETATTALRIARVAEDKELVAQLKWRIRSILDAE